MKILAIQNRMGIGDMVIFLPYIKAISENFNCPVTLLVKESSKADQYLINNNYIDKIIKLKRSNNKSSYHDGISGFFRSARVASPLSKSTAVMIPPDILYFC